MPAVGVTSCHQWECRPPVRLPAACSPARSFKDKSKIPPFDLWQHCEATRPRLPMLWLLQVFPFGFLNAGSDVFDEGKLGSVFCELGLVNWLSSYSKDSRFGC